MILINMLKTQRRKLKLTAPPEGPPEEVGHGEEGGHVHSCESIESVYIREPDPGTCTDYWICSLINNFPHLKDL